MRKTKIDSIMYAVCLVIAVTILPAITIITVKAQDAPKSEPVEVIKEVPTIEEVKTVEVEKASSWQPYKTCPLDEGTQLLIHEVVEENYPHIAETVLMAQAFYESDGQMIYAKSGSGAYGIFQLKPEFFTDRADKLNVDLYTEYGNALIAADYMYELCEKYGDVAFALSVYRKNEAYAMYFYDRAEISPYASKILEMSDEMQKELEDGI